MSWHRGRDSWSISPLLPLTLVWDIDPHHLCCSYCFYSYGPQHMESIKSARGIPSAGHKALLISSQSSLREHVILRCFACSPDISAHHYCFSSPPSCCCKMFLLGVASPEKMIGIKPMSLVLWNFSECYWEISHLQGNEMPSQGPSASQLYVLPLSFAKILSPMGQKVSQTSPFILTTNLLNCQALALDLQRKPWRNFFYVLFFFNSVL